MKAVRAPLTERFAGAASDRAATSPTESRATQFAIGEHDFLLNGKPYRVLSGALHYFRVHPDQWADRIRKARHLGLNTIETYVAWNVHAPTEETFDLTGRADIGHFLDLVAAEGMFAIVRPGPYICAEWHNGGLPGWLLRDPGVGIRCNETRFVTAASGYFRRLAPVLTPRQIDRGGPIILVQIENEYGAYGHDKSYLRALVATAREVGITVPLITVDQPDDNMLEDGSLPELHKTGSFGSRIDERLDTLRRHQATGPLMCSEFWDGWFDDWGSHHHVTSVTQTAADLEQLLQRGASVNIYMFHGGTNFGFTNGANDKGTYRPITTSYDYDAPLDEAGNPTAKYWALRDVLARYTDIDDVELDESALVPAATPAAAAAFTTPFDQLVPLWDVVDRLGRWHRRAALPSADELGQYSGFTLYRTNVELRGSCVLDVGEVHDRAQVFLDHRCIGVLARDHHDHAMTLPSDASGVLDLLVEDLGRVDYGPRLGEPKGLIGTAMVNDRPLHPWDVLPLNLDDLGPIADALRSTPPSPLAALPGPAFARARFDLLDETDLHLDTSAWGKGVAWINGFCLGRYWSRGPQQTLYVPAPVLRRMHNELIIFELHAGRSTQATFVSEPDLGPTQP